MQPTCLKHISSTRWYSPRPYVCSCVNPNQKCWPYEFFDQIKHPLEYRSLLSKTRIYSANLNIVKCTNHIFSLKATAFPESRIYEADQSYWDWFFSVCYQKMHQILGMVWSSWYNVIYSDPELITFDSLSAANTCINFSVLKLCFWWSGNAVGVFLLDHTLPGDECAWVE